jgi:predicted TIM-barrel fold metal-dependent hydrolase
VIEPFDMWKRYIDPKFLGREPQPEDLTYGLVTDGVSINTWRERDGHRSPEDYQRRIKEMHQSIDRTYAEAKARGFTAQQQLKDMDVEGVDVAVLYPSFGLFAIAADGLDPKLAAAVCRAYNTWLADFCKTDARRLRGAAMVPLHDAELAAAEARHAVRDLGLSAIFVRPNPVNRRTLDDPYFDLLWANVQDLNVPVAVHEGGRPRLPQAGAERYADGTMRHIASHAFEQMLACLSFIYGGALERFPRLQVAFLESGSGWAPFWLGRMDDHYEGAIRRRMTVSDRGLTRKPSDYFRRQCYISTEPEEEIVKYVVDWLGYERIVFSTDYPHPDAKFPHAVDHFLELPGISAEAKRRILWDNSARLYSCELAPAGR